MKRFNDWFHRLPYQAHAVIAILVCLGALLLVPGGSIKGVGAVIVYCTLYAVGTLALLTLILWLIWIIRGRPR